MLPYYGRESSDNPGRTETDGNEPSRTAAVGVAITEYQEAATTGLTAMWGDVAPRPCFFAVAVSTVSRDLES
jgi:hypothetical protein